MDDPLLFFDARVKDLRILRFLFLFFEAVSCLHGNLAKNEIISVGNAVETGILLTFFGCRIGSFPFSY